MRDKGPVIIIGGGLAGSEAALQLAKMGVRVKLFEMRPKVMTPAHKTGLFGELVCSNSLKSTNPLKAQGLLKEELKTLNSFLLEFAYKTQVEAGEALAVDRNKFAEMVTEAIENNPLIEVIREEVKEIPEGICIIASGPLTSPSLTESLMEITGEENLYFYDAISPIIYAETIDMGKVFKGGRGGDDYLNIPLKREEYKNFVKELRNAVKVKPHPFEDEKYFESCLPIEVLAERGEETLAYGPMKPVGLKIKGERPYAVVQLRKENKEGTLYNMVGFQTKLTISEQKRIFRTLPGLEKAEFARFGSIHRNTYINSPRLLNQDLTLKKRRNIIIAGQLTGTEGYVECIATGVIAGINAVRILEGKPTVCPPETTMIGALLKYISSASPDNFQPMNANFGLLPPVNERGYEEKRRKMMERSLRDLKNWLEEIKK